MIKNFKPRLYQQTIVNSAINHNALVVLPTGLGKTNIFLMVAAQRLKQYPNSKILLLGPTRPLIDQYRDVFISNFDINPDDVTVLTGQISPEKRAELWDKSKIILSTPQGLENDLITKRISLNNISLLGFDEAHKAVGDYAYVWVAKQYYNNARYPRIIGMTASPGSDKEKINEICKNLFIENIEVRTDEDNDVKPYIQDVKLRWVKVELPERFLEIKRLLETCIKYKLKEIKGDVKVHPTMSKKEILTLQAQIHAEIAHGNKDYSLLRNVSILAEVMKTQHALELLETQGLGPLHEYMEGIIRKADKSKVKAVQNLARDINFRSAYIKTSTLQEENILHPKLEELKKIVHDRIKKQPDTKIIIFNHYRDNAVGVVKEFEDIGCRLFVGQAKKKNTGLSQKEQKAMLDEFREHKFNVICMTSVGEEGLDIPKVDLVIFYEPIPSTIRHIQRRGRTGRLEKGEVIILMTKGTRDEAYRWSAHHKEKRMYRALRDIKKSITLETQPTLQKFASSKTTIYADHREKASHIIKELIDMDVDLKLEQLDCCDYVLSSRVGVEFKTKEDFVNSIVDGRLLSQLKDLRNSYEKPVIIVEGTEDIYSLRKVHPNAIQGMLSTIAVSYGVPIIFTKTPSETASILNVIAKREQEEGKNDYSLHGAKRTLSIKEQQEYIVSALPNVGPKLAKDLLKKFGSVSGVFKAKEKELTKVGKIGSTIAKKIRDVIEKEY